LNAALAFYISHSAERRVYCPTRYRVLLCGAFTFFPGEFGLLIWIDVEKSAYHQQSVTAFSASNPEIPRIAA